MPQTSPCDVLLGMYRQTLSRGNLFPGAPNPDPGMHGRLALGTQVSSGPAAEMAADSHGIGLRYKEQATYSSQMPTLIRDHLIPRLCHLTGRQRKTWTDCRETLSTQLLVLPLDMSGAPPPNPLGTPICLRDSLGLHKLFLSITQPS